MLNVLILSTSFSMGLPDALLGQWALDLPATTALIESRPAVEPSICEHRKTTFAPRKHDHDLLLAIYRDVMLVHVNFETTAMSYTLETRENGNILIHTKPALGDKRVDIDNPLRWGPFEVRVEGSEMHLSSEVPASEHTWWKLRRVENGDEGAH
jgi:hypothetical protein